MDAFFMPWKPCVLCSHQTEKTLGVVWGSWTSFPGPLPLSHSARRRGKGRRGGTGGPLSPHLDHPSCGRAGMGGDRTPKTHMPGSSQ